MGILVLARTHSYNHEQQKHGSCEKTSIVARYAEQAGRHMTLSHYRPHDDD